MIKNNFVKCLKYINLDNKTATKNIQRKKQKSIENVTQSQFNNYYLKLYHSRESQCLMLKEKSFIAKIL